MDNTATPPRNNHLSGDAEKAAFVSRRDSSSMLILYRGRLFIYTAKLVKKRDISKCAFKRELLLKNQWG